MTEPLPRQSTHERWDDLGGCWSFVNFEQFQWETSRSTADRELPLNASLHRFQFHTLRTWRELSHKVREPFPRAVISCAFISCTLTKQRQ